MGLLSLGVSLAILLCCCCLAEGQNLDEMEQTLLLRNLIQKVEALERKFDDLQTVSASLIEKSTGSANVLTEIKHLMEKDECADGSHNCSPNALCRNALFGFECSCNDGYKGDGHTCSDIDECQVTEVYGENMQCVNTEGSYQWQCPKGFQNTGGYCQDINECQDGLHECKPPLTCSNTQGGYECLCQKPYVYNGNRTSCGCQSPFIPVGGRCIFVDKTSGSQPAMRARCQNMGGDLLRLDSADLMYEVVEHLNINGPAETNFWVLGSDEGNEGIWAYPDGTAMKIGTPFWAYIDSWGIQEPAGGTSQNCVIMDFVYKYYQTDQPCNLGRSMICEATI